MTESLHLPDLFQGLTLEAGPQGLRAIRFGAASASPNNPGPIVRAAEQQLREYLAGERCTFTIPLDLTGTPFQLEVWHALTKIPYGSTASYRAIAQAVNRPKGFQAIGQANTRNPIPLIIPCHRVINADGSTGGYGGGLPRKLTLLQLEQNHAHRFRETAA